MFLKQHGGLVSSELVLPANKSLFRMRDSDFRPWENHNVGPVVSIHVLLRGSPRQSYAPWRSCSARRGRWKSQKFGLLWAALVEPLVDSPWRVFPSSDLQLGATSDDQPHWGWDAGKWPHHFTAVSTWHEEGPTEISADLWSDLPQHGLAFDNNFKGPSDVRWHSPSRWFCGRWSGPDQTPALLGSPAIQVLSHHQSKRGGKLPLCGLHSSKGTLLRDSGISGVSSSSPAWNLWGSDHCQEQTRPMRTWSKIITRYTVIIIQIVLVFIFWYFLCVDTRGKQVPRFQTFEVVFRGYLASFGGPR